MQNTPTGCGNDLPILLRNLFFVGFGSISSYLGIGRPRPWISSPTLALGLPTYSCTSQIMLGGILWKVKLALAALISGLLADIRRNLQKLT